MRVRGVLHSRKKKGREKTRGVEVRNDIADQVTGEGKVCRGFGKGGKM
jgi:hypothetical protein